MNAISRDGEEFTCKPSADMAGSNITRSAEHGASECNAIPENAAIQQVGWGGPRANSGGARPGSGPKPKLITTRQSLGLRWYVVETYPGAEGYVARELARQGWSHYLPMIAVRRRDRVLPTMVHKVIVPMFAGYLFVEFDRDSLTWGAIRDQCASVRGIIRDSNSRPVPLETTFVERLRASDAERLQLASLASPVRAAGTALTVINGPFTSFPAVVVECDGFVTTVNVSVFGRDVAVPMAWGDLSDDR